MATKTSPLTARTIPGTDGAKAIKDSRRPDNIEREIVDADGTHLGFVCMMSAQGIRPRRVVLSRDLRDVVGDNLAQAVVTLRARRAAKNA